MTRRVLLAIALLALAASARALAQETEPEPAVCEVDRDPAWVSPAGVLHVLDRTSSTVLRWSLSTRAALTPLALTAGGAAFAHVPGRDLLAIARTGPLRVSVRAVKDRAPEVLIAQVAGSSDLCGLGATDDRVVLCVRDGRQIRYLAYATSGATDQPLDSIDVGELPDPNDPNHPHDPNDPNSPPAPVVLPSWDSMAWNGETHTLFATRTQVVFRGALAVPILDDGSLGEVRFALPEDPNAPRAIEPLAVLSDGRLLAPDGLVVATDPRFSIETAPDDSLGEAFAIGPKEDLQIFNLVANEDDDTVCDIGSDDDATLSPDPRLSTGPVRTFEGGGVTWLLQGSGASAKLRRLRPDSDDLDGDRARDEFDVFPLEPVTARDWDHDGVEDKSDAAPTRHEAWRDSDGDGVADDKDEFPDNATEWNDSDEDGLGDHSDAFPGDKLRKFDLDSDGFDDKLDEANQPSLWINPLEHSDRDDDGVGNNGDAFPDDPAAFLPAFGSETQVFQLKMLRGTRLSGFESRATKTTPLLVLFDSNLFKICEIPGNCFNGSDEFLSGTVERRGRNAKTLKLRFDVRTLSNLFLDFAMDASTLVPTGDDPRASSQFFFVPKSVDSVGSGRLTKKGVSLVMRSRFSYKRNPKYSTGWKGAFVFRATGTPVELP